MLASLHGIYHYNGLKYNESYPQNIRYPRERSSAGFLELSDPSGIGEVGVVEDGIGIVRSIPSSLGLGEPNISGGALFRLFRGSRSIISINESISHYLASGAAVYRATPVRHPRPPVERDV